ncbi:MAG: type II toxin-antitoxin system VapC family toxin [Candidatus Dadabacteria bacterium]|nr:type II toxin-antitoxin system VapC family toxin [Candidatus Dadabacteria bacterium]
MQYVVDASIASEYLLKTPLGKKVAPILEQANLIAPSLLDVEVMSVFRRAVRLNKISEDRASIAIDDLKNWPVTRISHRKLLLTAWDYRNNLSAYDAFYAAAAKLFDSVLITSDGPLSRAPIPDVVIQNISIYSK